MKSFGSEELEKNVVRRPLDVTNPDSINAVVSEIVEREGRIDIVSKSVFASLHIHTTYLTMGSL